MTTEIIERPNNGRMLQTVEDPAPRGVAIASLDDLSRFAKMVFDSGLAPKGFPNAQAVAIAIQTGLEVGMTPMMALQNIAVINGKPGFYGDAAKALVEASGLLAEYDEHPGVWCDVCECEGQRGKACAHCNTVLKADEYHGFIVTSLRRGRAKPTITGFNIRQAKKAGLWGKTGPWTQYPNRMLMFRARGFNLRDNFPDVLKGFRTVEELTDYPITPGKIIAAPPSPSSVAPNKPAPSQPRKVTKKTLALLNEWAAKMELTPPDKEELCAQAGVQSFEELSDDAAQSLIHDLAEAAKRRDQAEREPGLDPEDESQAYPDE